MSEMPLAWHLGIDNVSDETNLAHGAVTIARNVDIDRAGGVQRRNGPGLVYATHAPHDIWTSESQGLSFAIVGGALCSITMPWSSTVLQPLTWDLPFSYCELNGDVVASSIADTFVMPFDLPSRRLGLEKPGAPTVKKGSTGGLDVGRYGVAISYLSGDEEGPLSPAGFATLTASGQGLDLSNISQPIEALPTAIRVYRTEPGGEILYRANDMALGVTSCTLSITKIGRPATNQFLDRMVPGIFVRGWKGMLWCVRGNMAWHSEPLRYGLYSPRHNFIMVDEAIRMFEPVENGIFVGTLAGVYFVAGNGPKEFTLHRLGGRAPIMGSAIRIKTSDLPKDLATGEYAAMWLSDNGYVVGTNEGRIIELQRERITLSGNAAASVLYNRQVTTTVN